MAVPPRGADDAPVRADEAEASLLRSLKGIGSVVAPTSLLTALLFYYGWVYTDAQSRFLGLDVSLLGFSTRDYLLRSLEPAFLPLIGLLLAALGFHWAHGVVMARLERGLPASFVTGLAAVAGLVLVASVVSALVGDDAGNNPFTPLGLTLGITLLSYAASLARARRRHQHREAATPPSATRRVIVLLLLAVCLFWAVSYYAQERGWKAGEKVAASIDVLPDAVVYSERPLFLTGAGVVEDALGDPGKPEAFRYSGLKLLLHANGRYFLLPAGWSLDEARTIVLPDDGASRLEFVRPS